MLFAFIFICQLFVDKSSCSKSIDDIRQIFDKKKQASGDVVVVVAEGRRRENKKPKRRIGNKQR